MKFAVDGRQGWMQDFILAGGGRVKSPRVWVLYPTLENVRGCKFGGLGGRRHISAPSKSVTGRNKIEVLT
jgi:hypothetical protein